MRDNWLIWRSVISDSGKPAFTEVATLAHLFFNASGTAEEDRYSLLVLKLHTGCTHQIRVHMQAIGHPLVCDPQYAENFFATDRRWCPRNFLHTYHLCFLDVPEGDELKPVHIYSPLPPDLRTAMADLHPLGEPSCAQLCAWLSSDCARLLSFEQFSCLALRPCSKMLLAEADAEAMKLSQAAQQATAAVAEALEFDTKKRKELDTAVRRTKKRAAAEDLDTALRQRRRKAAN
eukprot:gnl/TRDRNA2_/TRDRNA2_174031_c3_seq4.p1 gnl/TRDRNA2_/TRDRNA2_174031_c3~~gnl/TRDRNA2_/TRDRNA2_174031_c3_seq4.p1  ORF type:complete len:233 (-),score=39.17 gnl/TRDRNA2_/TRDRNA2_174031_c3_seq4:95-793(-)